MERVSARKRDEGFFSRRVVFVFVSQIRQRLFAYRTLTLFGVVVV